MPSIKNIQYSNENKSQLLDLYLPEEKEFPVFIYFHGGGLEAGDKTDYLPIEQLNAKGIAVVSANYRMYPDAVFPEFICDAAAVVAWCYNEIKNYGKCKGFFVGGSSAGGYLTQMLCFDKKYLNAYGIDADQIDGYFMDAGQPTSHFNVLRERGIDSRRVVVDETAPLYHVTPDRNYPAMDIIVSDCDMENRYEQTCLLYSTLKHCGCNINNVKFKCIENSTHCSYIGKFDDNGNSVFAEMILDFINRII